MIFKRHFHATDLAIRFEPHNHSPRNTFCRSESNTFHEDSCCVRELHRDDDIGLGYGIFFGHVGTPHSRGWSFFLV